MDKLLSFLLLFVVTFGVSQDRISHVDPPHWWFGMVNSDLEILIHGDKISGLTPKISEENIVIKEVNKGDSENYLFLLLDISKVDRAVDFTINLQGDNSTISIPYSLKKRSTNEITGVDASDAIYLITPDRYRNGNTENDQLSQYKEGLDRSNDFGRHGGDIEGIIQSLDYINDLGFNTIWVNPILENDMQGQSYHGYATTDYYKVDERFGGLKAYSQLKDELRKRDMSLIMDMIANHCGSEHWWMKDLPFNDWLNYQTEYLNNPGNFTYNTNHRKTTLLDPYIPKTVRTKMVDGWFVPTMPDLNQRNIHMSRYIIQNSIWWVETMQLAGIRQDTYSYPDEEFLTDWSCALIEEYPNLFIVGEEWSDNPMITSYWQAGKNPENHLSSPTTCLPSVMDFPMQMTVNKALKDEETWNNGLAKMYEFLVNDRLYTDPMNLVIMPDNHDMSRIYTQLDENLALWKIAMIYYATMRGIPQIYYGTEILMSNKGTDSHGVIRKEFPGGWKDHTKNVFEMSDLSEKETEAIQFLKSLYQWRRSHPDLFTGDLIHYPPKNSTYVYLRKAGQEIAMIVINKNSESQSLDLSRYDEILQGKRECMNVITNETLKNQVVINKNSASIFYFK